MVQKIKIGDKVYHKDDFSLQGIVIGIEDYRAKIRFENRPNKFISLAMLKIVKKEKKNGRQKSSR